MSRRSDLPPVRRPSRRLPLRGPHRRLRRGEKRHEFQYPFANGRERHVIIIVGGQWGEVWSHYRTLDGRWTHWMGGRHASAAVILRREQERAAP